jgi:hypothetical protein
MADENENFLGTWQLTISQGSREMVGNLRLRLLDDQLIGHVQGGPISVEVNGDSIAMAVDDRTGGGRPFDRYLTGTLEGDLMSGKFGPPDGDNDAAAVACKRYPLGCSLPTGTWQAVKIKSEKTQSMSAKPSDIAGVWTGRGGIFRWSMDLTPKGQAYHDSFDVELDLPSQRCVSAGPVWSFGRGAEIFKANDKITMLYTSDVRHIYLNRTAPPENQPHSPMGYSTGHWEGDTLVVNTSLISTTVRGWMGDPISENARTVERYWLNEDQTLSGEQILYDPENYKEPPMKSFQWTRKTEPPGSGISFACDPDSFILQMIEDGKTQIYYDRVDKRY